MTEHATPRPAEVIETAQDVTLPSEAGTVEQVAVVYTALAGPKEGQRVYQPLGGEKHMHWLATEYLPARAAALGKPCDAKVMRRQITCGPWKPLHSAETGGSCAEADMVNHPPHYRHPSGIECIVFTRHLSFDAGNAFKYIWRADAKNGRQDIEKARWYLRDAIAHGDAPFLQSWYTVQAQLDVVLYHETNRDRWVFFDAIGRGNLGRALDAVQSMLEDIEDDTSIGAG